jgi:hypothetical protein
VRKLAPPLRIRDVVVGGALFELAFALWVGIYFILEPTLSPDEPELIGWFYFGLWLVAGVSAVMALVGVLVAESMWRRAEKVERTPVALLAGTFFGLGWLVVYGVSVAISKVAPDTEAAGVPIFWSYLLAGPVFAFGLSAKLLGKVPRRVPTAAV